jgi:uncharacterized protein
MRQAFINRLLQHLRMVEVFQLASGRCNPKDDQFLGLALTVNAEMVIDSDPRLTQMHP